MVGDIVAGVAEELTLDAVCAARDRIAAHVMRTPLLRYRLRGDCELLCKPESLQPTGSFKLRGAFSRMTALPSGCNGVVAHSSGNHAQAVARAASVLGLRALVVMPEDAPSVKRARTEADGAEVVVVGADSEERARAAERLGRERGLVEVPPFDHPLIAAGQGTAALELLEDAEALERFYAPVGGGGLMAGCATVFAERLPACELVGCEPEDADDTRRSLAAGERQSVPPPRTIADGLRVRTPGAVTFPVLRKHVSRIEVVTDDELLDAMRFALRELRLVLEPSGAASLAVALREGKGRCGVLLSGGNVDPSLLAQVIAP